MICKKRESSSMFMEFDSNYYDIGMHEAVCAINVFLRDTIYLTPHILHFDFDYDYWIVGVGDDTYMKNHRLVIQAIWDGISVNS